MKRRLDTLSSDKGLSELIARGMGELNFRKFYDVMFIRKTNKKCQIGRVKYNYHFQTNYLNQQECNNKGHIRVTFNYQTHRNKYCYYFCVHHWKKIVNQLIKPYISEMVNNATLRVQLTEKPYSRLKVLKTIT